MTPLIGSVRLGMADAPSNPTEGQLYYDTDDGVLYAYTGTSWVLVFSGGDGSSANLAILGNTPITSLLAARGESDGAVTPGVYWFRNGNAATYTFPAYVSNHASVTWILLQKNFPPHAYKDGDGVHASDHALSYGLINASGAAIVTGDMANGSADLGTKHAKVHIDSFADGVFTEMLGFANNDYWYKFTGITDLDSKLRIGMEGTSGTSWETHTFYTPDASQSGAPSMFWVFNFALTASDWDWGRMGFTDSNSINHDTHNEASDWNGVSHFQDGGSGGGYDNNKDGSLNGNGGKLSVWVRE